MKLKGKITSEIKAGNDKNKKRFSCFSMKCDEKNNIKGDATFVNCYAFDNQAKEVKEKCKKEQFIEVDGAVKFKLHNTTDNKILNVGYMMLKNIILL